MHYLEAKLASLFSPSKSKASRPGSRLRTMMLAAVVPAALIAAMAISVPSAGAVACTGNILCSGGGAGAKIRDDFDNAPAFKGYGANILATNTQSTLRLRAFEGEKEKFSNTIPANYAYFGIDLLNNPVTSTTVCNDSEGWVTFADIQNSTPSPVYAGTSPTRFAAWPVVIYSNALNAEKKPVCGANAGRVTIENAHLFFSALGATAAGTFVGSYEQPGANCAAGGVKLDIAQPGVTAEAGGVKFTSQIDNGAGANAFICFVSSNNVVFPTTAPTWTPLTGSVWHD